MADENKIDDGATQKPASGVEQKKEEVAAYEKLRLESKRVFAEMRENVNAESIRGAVDKAANRLKEAGGYTTSVLNKASEALKKDAAYAMEKLGPKWDAFSEKSADIFEVWRDRSALFLSQASVAVGEWLQKAGTKLGHLTYRAGEMTSAGEFSCTACGELIVQSEAGHLVECPKCQGTEFRRN